MPLFSAAITSGEQVQSQPTKYGAETALLYLGYLIPNRDEKFAMAAAARPAFCAAASLSAMLAFSCLNKQVLTRGDRLL